MSWGTQEVPNRMASISFRWLAFDEHAEAIRGLRRQVFMEEQFFGGSMLSSPDDGRGLHLGAFHGQKLVAVMSASIFEKPCEELAPYGPSCSWAGMPPSPPTATRGSTRPWPP